jgi:hypothetical protein
LSNPVATGEGAGWRVVISVPQPNGTEVEDVWLIATADPKEVHQRLLLAEIPCDARFEPLSATDLISLGLEPGQLRKVSDQISSGSPDEVFAAGTFGATTSEETGKAASRHTDSPEPLVQASFEIEEQHEISLTETSGSPQEVLAEGALGTRTSEDSVKAATDPPEPGVQTTSEIEARDQISPTEGAGSSELTTPSWLRRRFRLRR